MSVLGHRKDHRTSPRIEGLDIPQSTDPARQTSCEVTLLVAPGIQEMALHHEGVNVRFGQAF